MTQENRETLIKACGILIGLSASGNISNAETDLIAEVATMIESVLEKEQIEVIILEKEKENDEQRAD